VGGSRISGGSVCGRNGTRHGGGEWRSGRAGDGGKQLENLGRAGKRAGAGSGQTA
jgi:hypothetical protein